MCGIVGVFNFNGEPVFPVDVKQMSDAIAHRGPDGEGFYIESFIGLGHRRLAIIDLSPAGHQPMMTDDKRFVLTYNGEIYNYQELRVELEALGHRFRSRTDSEVVLNAFAEWGPECLGRLNGMFSFAVWDKFLHELFLARDRYGIKPLYYVFREGTLLFASEQKAILAHPRGRSTIDVETLLEYFTFQNIFTDRTFLKGVRMLKAGCWAKVGLGTTATTLDQNQYWDFNFREPDHQATDDEYLEELDRLFRRAVNRQLVGDVDVGSYLSGGMDSGSITAIAAAQLPYIKTFTCGFDLHSISGLELAFDEREKAEIMSYRFKTEHYEMVLKAGDMERVLPRLTYSLEDPRVGQSYPNFYVAQLASKFVKVVLSGTGGDEVFGGYPWRYFRNDSPCDFEQYIDKYYLFWQRLIPNRLIQRVFSPIWSEVSHVWTRDIFRSVFRNSSRQLDSIEDYISHSMYFESKTFLHGLLIVEDKLSMAHGLETRVPFLDNDLVDFAMQVPARLKLKVSPDSLRLNENEPGPKSTMYFRKTNDGKLIFRRLMERYIPEEVTGADKQGFSAPDASWFRGDSIAFVKRILFDRHACIYDFLDPVPVQELIQEHLEGRQNRRLFIWSLLNVEYWCRAFLGGHRHELS